MQVIHSNAFLDCGSLDNIYISKNVNNIANNAFNGCTNLTNIEIAEENTKYSYSQGNGMLMDLENNNILFISGEVLKNITTFSIPEGITNFNIDMRNYTNITKIVIPQSLEGIGNAGIFPTSISSIEIVDGNTNFMVENECLYNGDKTELIMCFTKDIEVDFADEVTKILANSFKQATNIENVDFDGNIKEIGEQVLAWDYNSKIQNVYIGANASSINPIFKFNNYSGTVVIDEANPNYSIENNELYNKDKSVLISILHDIQGDYTVKDSVKKIGDRAFHYMSGMTSIILPEGLEEIGASFNSCKGLKEIYIPNSVEKIASDAFNNSYNLMHIRIDKEPNTIEGAPWGAVAWDRAIEWLRPAE